MYSRALEEAIGFLLYPKARQHARLLLQKVKSVLTLLLKICAQHLIAFEVLYRHLRMAYKALLTATAQWFSHCSVHR